MAPATTTTGTATNQKAVQAIAITPKAASLISQDPNSRINVRSQPTTRSSSSHYGVSGDPVTLLQKTTDAEGAIWYFLKFDQSGAEGWVRGDFVDTSAHANRPTGAGNQPSQPAPQPPVASRPSGTPETYMTMQNADEIAVQIREGEFYFHGTLKRTSGNVFVGSDGRAQVIYDRGAGRVTVINPVTGTEFYNYRFTDINEGSL